MNCAIDIYDINLNNYDYEVPVVVEAVDGEAGGVCGGLVVSDDNGGDLVSNVDVA